MQSVRWAAQGLTQQVLYFDGKNTYLELPVGMVDTLAEGTVEAWVKWEKFNKWARVFDFGQESNAAVIQTEKTSSTLNFAYLGPGGETKSNPGEEADPEGGVAPCGSGVRAEGPRDRGTGVPLAAHAISP